MDFEKLLENKKPYEKIVTACFSPDFILHFNVSTWKDDIGVIWHQCDAYCMGEKIHEPTQDHWKAYLQLKFFIWIYNKYDYTGYTIT